MAETVRFRTTATGCSWWRVCALALVLCARALAHPPQRLPALHKPSAAPSAAMFLQHQMPLKVALQAPHERASKRIAESSAAFSVDLIRTVLTQTTGNAVLSPLSVSAMMAMVALGAAGNSSAQLEAALRASADELREGFRAIVHSLKNRETRSSLELGSGVFLSNALRVSPAFQEQLYSVFRASVEYTDFSSSPATAARAINRWVAVATRGRIPDIISPAAIHPRTQLVLANAVYFRGVWQRAFNANKTFPAPFSPAPNAPTVTAPFMHQAGRLRGGEDAALGAKWVELPFDGGEAQRVEFSMVLVLPLERHGLQGVLRRMTPAHLANMLRTRTPRQVHLSLPRFSLASAVSLLPPLQELGIRDIFDCNSDLSGIATGDVSVAQRQGGCGKRGGGGGGGGLMVSDVIHKAQVEVNEEGSSASASSAVVVNTLSLNSFADELSFMADQPFLTFIVDRVYGLPLFAGRVSNPLVT